MISLENGSMFFFEKKNQKTFVSERASRKESYQDIKVFCFFFSKKKCLLSFLMGERT